MIETSSNATHRRRSANLALTQHQQVTKTRIQEILADNLIPRYNQGDDSATTLISIGHVLLASALADTTSAAELAAITSFEEDFTEIVMATMQEFNLFATGWFENLRDVVHETKPTPREVMVAFNDATAGFNEADWDTSYSLYFEMSRARLVIGGKVQNYIDETFFEEFVRHGGILKQL